jgi:hypothetical protein
MKAALDKSAVYRSGEEFAADMFPRATRQRAQEAEQEHPRAAGTRSAEEAIARLKLSAKAG